MKSSVDQPTARCLLASALLGAASGMRSTVGLAAVIARSDPDRLPPALTHRLAKPAAGVAVAAELVLDKLPFTGSRLEPAGIAGRLVFAAAGAVLLARRSSAPALAAALVAIAAAGATAKVAHDLRERLSESVPDVAVALAEDFVALGTAAAALRS
jgi:hypothetical protein